MDRGVWKTTVHGVTKIPDMTELACRGKDDKGIYNKT